MTVKRILIVDDETAISSALKYYLEREGHQAVTAENGSTAFSLINRFAFDLIVLDIMLPDINGLDITRMLKKNAVTARVPIIMLTAKSEEVDVVIGFELDVADYVTKPFSARILVSRINSVLRRREETPSTAALPLENRLIIKELEVSLKAHETFIQGHKTELTKTEFELLLFLMQHPGWVYSRSQIVDELKGSDYPVTDRSVDSQIMNLRKKLGPCGNYIETVRGVGYRFVNGSLVVSASKD